MKLTNKALTLFLLLAILTPYTMQAQIVKRAQTSFRFLENPVSAEVMGRGGVGILTTENANGLFWNPALIAWQGSTLDVSLNHAESIADITYNAVGLTYTLGSFGVVGASIMAMNYGTFYETREAANENDYIETGTFSPSAMVFGLAFSQKMSDKFSYGVHVKYARQDLGSPWVSTAGLNLTDKNLSLEQKDYAMGIFLFDVGAIYDFKYNGIRFAAAVQNTSEEIRYEVESFPAPFAVSFGLTVAPTDFFMERSKDHSFILEFESRHPRDFKERIKIGGEYTYQNLFTARAGYQTNADERGFTFGGGLKHEVAGYPVRLDYAYEPFGIFGGRHFISLGFSY